LFGDLVDWPIVHQTGTLPWPFYLFDKGKITMGASLSAPCRSGATLEPQTDIPMLHQSDTSTCTGFSLASVICHSPFALMQSNFSES
jgi:hypothetical protein